MIFRSSMRLLLIFPEEICVQAIWYFSKPIAPGLPMSVFMSGMVNLSMHQAVRVFLLQKSLPVTGVPDIWAPAECIIDQAYV